MQIVAAVGRVFVFDVVTAGSFPSEMRSGVILGQGRNLKFGIRCGMGNQAMTPCEAQDVTCTSNNSFYTKKMSRASERLPSVKIAT